VVAALALTVVGLGGFASSASATFHLIKVRELFPGTATAPQSDYVELQAYSPFQNQLQFGQLKVYGANGTNLSTFMPSTPPAPVPNNANQATAVVADTGFAAEFPGVTPDFIDSSLDLNPAAGAVCWPITEPPFEDCVSWGAFTGNANLPDSAGSPFQGSGTSGAIGDGESIVRSISANCPTALDDADDTNNSAADFSESAPKPRPNSAPITEAVCSTGPGVAPNPVKKAKKKCKKRRRRPGAGSGKPTTGGGSPAYAAKKKKCKKKRK
jgi:hypothetical protein